MEFKNEFEKAQDIVREAGKIILSYYGSTLKISLKADSTWLTKIDTEVESFIYDKLKSLFPDYGFLGEEGEDKIKDIAWIVDPIDGTAAFTRHIPEFGIALAFKKGDKVIFSIEYIPLIDSILTAYESQGAYCNGKRIQVNDAKNLHEIILSIGARNYWNEEFRDYTIKLTENNYFRVGFSSVFESYYLATGKTDIYVRFAQAIWDVAPEYLIMKEAGAIITDECSNPLTLHFSKTARHNVIATSPFINKEFHSFLYSKAPLS